MLSAGQSNKFNKVNGTQKSTSSTKATAGGRLNKIKVVLKGSAVLLSLLGLTWIFGLFVFNRETIVFKFFFTICNSLQGLMIFVFHVLLKKKVKVRKKSAPCIFQKFSFTRSFRKLEKYQRFDYLGDKVQSRLSESWPESNSLQRASANVDRYRLRIVHPLIILLFFIHYPYWQWFEVY